jgi:hypothetical protein
VRWGEGRRNAYEIFHNVLACKSHYFNRIPLNDSLITRLLKFQSFQKNGECGRMVGWGIMVRAGRSWLQFPMRSSDFFNSNHSSHTMALGSTHPLTEMSIRNIPGTKGQLVHKADNFTAICEPTVENVGASMSQNRMSLHGLLQG